MKQKNFSKTLSLLGASLLIWQSIVSPKVFTNQVLATKQDKIIICHRTNSASNPYTSNNVDINSADGSGGNGDHYLEHQGPIFDPETMTNGDDWGDIIPPIENAHDGLNWTTGGQDIYDNNCQIPLPVVDITPSPSVSPSVPSGVSPTPTVTPTATPSIETQGEDPANPKNTEHSKLQVAKLCCGEQKFKAEMILDNDGQPLQDVLVAFTYNGVQQIAYTDPDGKATTDFTFTGEETVQATPNNGYQKQEAKASQDTNCPDVNITTNAITDTNSGINRGQVLGANTYPTSYANTGLAEDIFMSLIGLSGATMTVIGAFLHGKKQK